MQKDVIYIDTEDDITAIIGKVKAAEQHIVALVPPKRIGAIQSAVNLKLVHRAAEQAGKRLVIISNNGALMALAGSVGIPVAKSLQSRPEIAEIPALNIDDGDDVIDGDNFVEPLSGNKKAEDAALNAVMTDDVTAASTDGDSSNNNQRTKRGGSASRGKTHIPNFNKFRKKLFIILGLVILLVGFIVWATVFAPHATVTVTARASSSALSTQVKLGTSLTTSLTDGTIKAILKTSTKSVSIPFTATGKKDEGTRATGTVTFSNSENSTSATLPAGYKVSSSSGATYITEGSVTVPGATLSHGKVIPGTASVTVIATANGSSYNGATGSASTDGTVDGATFTTATSGGTDKTVTIVQQGDIDNVSGDIVSQSDSDAAKKALESQLGSSYIVLDTSFRTDTSAVTASPAVGAEAADSKGTLAGTLTFSIVAVPRSEVGTFLDAYYAQQIDGKSDQKVYDNGLSGVSLTNISALDNSDYSANITANGKIGPKIDDDALKQIVKGKKSGEIQSDIEQTNGVDSVDVKLSPFWVTTAPNDTSKIQISFKVND